MSTQPDIDNGPEFSLDHAPEFSIDALMERAQSVEANSRAVAETRRDSLERLTDHVRNLSAANGDLCDRIEQIEALRQDEAAQHASEVSDLLERLRHADAALADAIAKAAADAANAANREAGLAAELETMTANSGRVAREFQRFVDQVDRDATTVAQDTVETERSIDRIGGARAPSPSPRPAPRPTPQAEIRPLAARDNLVVLATATPRPAAERSFNDDAVAERSEIAAARGGFSAMFTPEQIEA